MRALTQDEMVQVAGGWFCWGWSSWSFKRYKLLQTHDHLHRQPKTSYTCEPKPADTCEPSPSCQPSHRSATPKPVCPPGLILPTE
jgi:hypothetical protein